MEKKEDTPLVGSNEAEDAAQAKREQTYTIMAICGLITVNVIKVQLTAHLFESQNYPTAYSFWSAVCTIVLLIPIFLIKPNEWGMPTKEMLPIMTAVVLFTTFDMAFQNIALANTATALVMCIMATNPFWTVMIETALYCKVQHALIYFTVMLLVVGAVFVSLGTPISHTSAYGTICASLAVLCSASKAVFTHRAFAQYKKVLGPMALLFWVDIMMLPIYIVWTLADKELGVMFQDTMHDSYKFWMLTMTASLGGVRALMGFYVLSYISATSTAVVNIFTQDLNILISIPIQKIAVGAKLAGGVSISMTSSAFYTFIKTYKPFLPWVDSFCSRPSEA
jgi:drug/metabolite transporter (DMT)-like permease